MLTSLYYQPKRLGEEHYDDQCAGTRHQLDANSQALQRISNNEIRSNSKARYNNKDLRII